MDKTSLRFGKFSVIVSLNILHICLAYTSSSSSMPMILRFGLLMESLSSCIFLSQLLHCLIKIFFCFFFNFCLTLSSETLYSTYSSLLEWPSNVFFFFFLTKGIFISRISVDSFF
jgi:hypothetical protein